MALACTSASLTPEQKLCLRGCRDYQQYHKMRTGFQAGNCAFCKLDRTINQVDFENNSWLVFPNAFPRKELKTQLLIVPKRHVRSLAELCISEPEMRDFAEAFKFVGSHYDLPGGMIFARFGDMSYNAGTVPHFHINVWVPNKAGEVRIPIYKTEAAIAENEARMAGFARRYETGEVPM